VVFPVTIDVSVVVPVMNEQDNVRTLLSEIVDALQGEFFEVLFVDDCSSDQTVAILTSAKAEVSELRVLQHKQNCGQSSGVRTGVLHAAGDTLVVLDGDGQNDPADIPALLAAYRRADQPKNLAMVGGVRQGRKDTEFKKFASRVGNKIRQSLLKDRSVDAGCGLKVFSKASFLRLPYFDHMHRFMAALMLREGFEVDFVPVNHRPRMHGTSKYGVFDRLLVSLSDMLGIIWLKRRCRLPSQVDEV
jgi:glycosyltransferase involved in cell wall biosynthesis